MAIHTEPFSFNIWMDRGLGLFTRLAVPFFFVATGFLLFNGKVGKEKAVGYIKRILILYVIWGLAYLFINYVNTIQKILYQTFISGIGHLWYLKATIVAVALVWLLSKRFSDEKVLIISACFLVFGTLLSTYAPVTERIIGGVLGHLI